MSMELVEIPRCRQCFADLRGFHHNKRLCGSFVCKRLDYYFGARQVDYDDRERARELLAADPKRRLKFDEGRRLVS
jgi:hypothetical protein